jgi:hypothetical protein
MTESVESQGSVGGSRLRVAAWSGAALLLLLPAVAMQFTDEVNWSTGDFVIMGIMIAVVGGVCELTVRATGNTTYRAGVGLAVLACFLLTWANAAVGLIGSEDNPANMMYAGVLALVIIGAVIARGQAPGMARTMFATVAALVVIAAIAMVLRLGAPYTTPVQIVWLTTFFAALFAGAGVLFQRVADSG